MKKFFNLIIYGLIIYGLYYVADQTQVFKRIDCLGLGGTPVKVSEIGANTLDDVAVVCAEPTTDANKDCYDNEDCTGDCIIERYSDGYDNVGDFLNKNESNKRGYCQPFKEMDCYVARERGTIVIHKCNKTN